MYLTFGEENKFEIKNKSKFTVKAAFNNTQIFLTYLKHAEKITVYRFIKNGKNQGQHDERALTIS